VAPKCPVTPRLPSCPLLGLAALVLAGCGGPAEITPTLPTADEIRATEQALEAAAAAERPATAPAAK